MARPELFLLLFIAGLMLGVRLMFFGAEIRRGADKAAPRLRRSEPAIVVFFLAFGAIGYWTAKNGASVLVTLVAPGVGGIVLAALAMRVALAMSRIQLEHDPEDPRYVHQGRVGVVSVAIPAGGEGTIQFESTMRAIVVLPARELVSGAIAAGEEICIERVENGVAHVELWAAVEHRL